MELIEITDLFQCDIGAPEPLILSTDSRTFVAFNGVRNNNNFHEIIVIEFIRSLRIIHGMPNNETLNGHPYYELGLSSYRFFMLKDSDLIETMARINSVHPLHSANNWQNLNHYILTFHDSMVECVADSYVFCEEEQIMKIVSAYFNFNNFNQQI